MVTPGKHSLTVRLHNFFSQDTNREGQCKENLQRPKDVIFTEINGSNRTIGAVGL